MIVILMQTGVGGNGPTASLLQAQEWKSTMTLNIFDPNRHHIQLGIFLSERNFQIGSIFMAWTLEAAANKVFGKKPIIDDVLASLNHNGTDVFPSS